MGVPEGTDDADCRWAAMSAPEGAAHAYMHAEAVPKGATEKRPCIFMHCGTKISCCSVMLGHGSASCWGGR